MRIVVAVVGKPRDHALAEAIGEYERRAAWYWSLDVHEVREESARGRSPDVVQTREAERLLTQLPSSAVVVTCEVKGRAMTSEQFAKWLSGQRDEGRDVALVIGGAFGLGEPIQKTAAWSLSLAPWTLPHELARLVLAEQLYRAGTIARGEPYHK